MTTGQELLKRLAACDESCLREVVSARGQAVGRLDLRTRALVRLSALLATDAATASLCWAVDLASAAGADDAELLQVLISAAPATGSAQVVMGAPRLARAVGMDLDAADAPRDY